MCGFAFGLDGYTCECLRIARNHVLQVSADHTFLVSCI